MIEPGSDVDEALNLLVDRVMNGPWQLNAADLVVDPMNGEHMVALGARAALHADGFIGPPEPGEREYEPWYGVEPKDTND